ncbi:HlyD family efflux transporter periplasmic adaptor subunit [Methylocella sp.]|uniref:HlyD family efflux transporter periplasmic adaptor subunit n=1 Tax=Methylocella sp. TaxID=1978226 RepID=UPI00378406B1
MSARLSAALSPAALSPAELSPRADAAAEGATLLAPSPEHAGRPGADRPDAARLAPQKRRLSPYFKTTGALLLIGLGVYSIAREQGFVASDNAVVSTRVISLRAPIDGVAAHVVGAVGAMARQGERLVEIANPRFEDRTVVELRETLKRLTAQREAAKSDRAALETLAAELARRATIHKSANVERLDGLIAEADRMLQALDARRAQAQADLDRAAPLAARAIVSRAAEEKFRIALAAAAHDVEAQQGRLDALRAESKAARAGVLSSPGGIDVSYSAQRADQTAMEIAHLTRVVADHDAEAKMIAARLKNEERLAAQARSAELVAPVSGMIWRLGASDAERLGAGDMAVELVDCAAPTLLVSVPQDRFSDVKIGAKARFRLSGETIEREGTVLSIAGQGDLGEKGHYAAMPMAERGPTIIAQIGMTADMKTLDGAPEPCLIGRTARALLPTSGGGPLDQIARRLF